MKEKRVGFSFTFHCKLWAALFLAEHKGLQAFCIGLLCNIVTLYFKQTFICGKSISQMKYCLRRKENQYLPLGSLNFDKDFCKHQYTTKQICIACFFSLLFNEICRNPLERTDTHTFYRITTGLLEDFCCYCLLCFK